MARNARKGPRFIGLCTGRCGSRYLAQLLTQAGLLTFHERNADLAAWCGDWNGGRAVGEISGHFVMQGDPWPDAKVWHFTRHPQPFVTSLIKFGFWGISWACDPTIHPFVRCTGNILDDSYRYWLDWNRKIMEIPEPRRTTFRIEDVSRCLIADLAATIDMRADIDKISPAWNEKQRFAEIPGEVRSEVWEMMECLGYDPVSFWVHDDDNGGRLDDRR